MIVYVVQANYVWDESEVYHVQKIFENEEMANEYVKDQRSKHPNDFYYIDEVDFCQEDHS